MSGTPARRLGLLLLPLLAAACGGGGRDPAGPPAPPPLPPSSPPEPADLPDREPLPFPAPGADPDFPAKAPARPGDWLDRFDERGQTAEEYRVACRNRLTAERRRILLQPLGALGERDALLGAVEGHLRAFFPGAVVERAPPLPLAPGAWKEGRRQCDASALLADLGNRLRGDVLARLALCEEDLHAEGMNFVFGLASPRLRTGVFSLARYGGGGEAAFLRRALKVAAHETGHLLGLEHCIRYECLMNGSNSLAETDRSPLHECPECGEKLRWNLGFDPAARWEGLAAFLEGAGLAGEGAFARRQAGKSKSRGR